MLLPQWGCAHAECADCLARGSVARGAPCGSAVSTAHLHTFRHPWLPGTALACIAPHLPFQGGRPSQRPLQPLPCRTTRTRARGLPACPLWLILLSYEARHAVPPAGTTQVRPARFCSSALLAPRTLPRPTWERAPCGRPWPPADPAPPASCRRAPSFSHRADACRRGPSRTFARA